MKSKSVKVGTTVFLGRAQRQALAKLSARLDVSMGHLVREGIRLVLAHYSSRGGRHG